MTRVQISAGAMKGFLLFTIASRLAMGLTSLLSSGYWELFPKVLGWSSVKWTIHLHLVPRFRMCGAIPHSPKCLHAMVF